MNKFKVGKKAILIKHGNCTHGFELGERVEIFSVDEHDSGLPYHIKGEKSERIGWANGDMLKAISEKHFKSLPRDYTGTIEIENGFIVEKEILDETEKEYLSAVIKPFRNSIKYIVLVHKLCDSYELNIDMDNDCMVFPFFEKHTMYAGMEPDKEYTLEELGL